MKKRIMLFTLCLTIFLFSMFKLFTYVNSDKMENSGIIKIKYQVYTDKGWSKWYNSGVIAGDLKNNIKKIRIKVNNSSDFVYSLYNKKKWSKVYNSSDNTKTFDSFSGVKMNLYFGEAQNYDIYYRTYNSSDKWLNWTCNDLISGNKNKAITGIQIKIIPKNVILSEYLSDYKNNKKYNEGF